MTDYFNTVLPEDEIRAMSSLALAHIGDAVYELLVRTHLCRSGLLTAGSLHGQTVKYVSAPAQASAAEVILPALTQDEAEAFRRGRNCKVHSVPKNADISQYHAATAIEALFGWLYLHGRLNRINELFVMIMEGGSGT